MLDLLLFQLETKRENVFIDDIVVFGQDKTVWLLDKTFYPT